MTIEDFLKYVLPEVPGCPSVVATRAVIESAKEFLTFTGAYSEIQDAIPMQADVQEYDLEAPSGYRCIDIKAIYTLTGQLTPVTIEQLARIMPNWQSAEGSVATHYTRAFDFTTFRVYPLPTAPGSETLTIHGVYTLRDNSTSIPDVIVDRYQEQIAAGAKARLQRTGKDNPWYDVESAKINHAIFNDGKLVAKVTAAHGNTAGHVTVPPRRFGS